MKSSYERWTVRRLSEKPPCRAMPGNSCVPMRGDPNRAILEGLAQDFESHLSRATFSACHWIAKGVLEGHLMSNVGRATHYHARHVSPEWQSRLRKITRVGDHLFYEEV